jgi:hypothetical protein
VIIIGKTLLDNEYLFFKRNSAQLENDRLKAEGLEWVYYDPYNT